MHYKNKTAVHNKTINDRFSESRADAPYGDNDPEREVKEAGRVKHLNIHHMDDDTYHMVTTTDKGHSQETTHPHLHHLLAQVEDNFRSPHLPKLGSGARFASLKDKLSQQPGVRNPGALSAFIGRKKFGAAKFDALSH